MRFRERSWLVDFPRILPAALFFLVVAVTASGIFTTETIDQQEREQLAQENAEAIASEIERRGESFASLLVIDRALFAASGGLQPRQFRRLVNQVSADQALRGAQGFGWIEVFEEGETEAFLNRARAYQPAFPDISQVNPLADGTLAVLTYLGPETPENRVLLGIDLYAHPLFAPSMFEAVRTNQPTATGKIVPDYEGAPEGAGIAISVPVYAPQPETSEAQGREVIGFFQSWFLADQFLADSMQQAGREGASARLYDGAVAEASLLASNGPVLTDAMRSDIPVEIANRQMMLVVETPVDHALTPTSMGLAIFGLTLASMLALVMRLVAKQAVEDRARLSFLEEQQSIRDSLNRELNHRVKNTLANVLSILLLTRRRSTDLDQFATGLEGRIRALSSTHSLLSEAEWGATPIRGVIESEMAQLIEARGEAITLEGPAVDLAPSDALVFGLAIHELASNAVQYGALSVSEGKLAIRWHLHAEDVAEVEWLESGGPEVCSQRSRGFGSDLIERVISAEFSEGTELEFRPEGVRCVLRVPVRQRNEFQMRGASQKDG